MNVHAVSEYVRRHWAWARTHTLTQTPALSIYAHSSVISTRNRSRTANCWRILCFNSVVDTGRSSFTPPSLCMCVEFSVFLQSTYTSLVLYENFTIWCYGIIHLCVCEGWRWWCWKRQEIKIRYWAVSERNDTLINIAIKWKASHMHTWYMAHTHSHLNIHADCSW